MLRVFGDVLVEVELFHRMQTVPIRFINGTESSAADLLLKLNLLKVDIEFLKSLRGEVSLLRGLVFHIVVVVVVVVIMVLAVLHFVMLESVVIMVAVVVCVQVFVRLFDAYVVVVRVGDGRDASDRLRRAHHVVREELWLIRVGVRVRRC